MTPTLHVEPMTDKSELPSILTNMAFWQSPEWTDVSESIYALDQGHDESDDAPWWKAAWILFRRRKGYDVVLTMGARESLAYGVLCGLRGCASRQIMTEVFIDDVSHPSLFWRLKTRLYRWTARRALGIITNSSLEIDTMSRRFNLPRDRFRYVPLNTTIAEPHWTERNEGYLFSAGRTLRDYSTLVDAVRDLERPLHIVCGYGDLPQSDLPDSIVLHREISRPEYLDLLEGAALVVLPLLPTERATGQVVMLEAMALGKPVITSEAPGTLDHMEDRVTGRLVPCGDTQALQSAICHWLDQPEEAEACARRALNRVRGEFTIEHHARLRMEAVRDLYVRFGRSG